MGSSICWHANSVLIDFLLSHILLGTGICSYIYHTFRPKKSLHKSSSPIPIGSMYGIFTYIYHKNQPNVGKYTIVPWILWPIEVWCFFAPSDRISYDPPPGRWWSLASSSWVGSLDIVNGTVGHHRRSFAWTFFGHLFLLGGGGFTWNGAKTL